MGREEFAGAERDALRSELAELRAQARRSLAAPSVVSCFCLLAIVRQGQQVDLAMH